MTTDPSGPLILVATNRLKPGKLDAERTRVEGLAAFLKEQNRASSRSTKTSTLTARR